MKNTLRFSLLIIGSLLIIAGLLSLIKPDMLFHAEVENGVSQSLAMMAFGALCFISGMAYKRR